MSTRLNILAAALVASLPGLVAAQSAVTVFGKIDSGFGKNIGSDLRAMQQGAASRVGFRGTEDLGDGLKVFFALEHRFNSDTGAQTIPSRFWHGEAILGIEGRWGRLVLGREYTPAYIQTQLLPDPFIHTTTASLLNVSTGGIGTVRNDQSITYQADLGRFRVAAQVAEAVSTTSNFADRPEGLSVTYISAPLVLSYGYENPGGANDVWHFAAGNYTVGPAVLMLGYGQGKTDTSSKRRAVIVGAKVSIGVGKLKLAYGDLRNTSTDVALIRKPAIGYDHYLSKRTFVYVNVSRDQVVANSKRGYDLGIQHNF